MSGMLRCLGISTAPARFIGTEGTGKPASSPLRCSAAYYTVYHIWFIPPPLGPSSCFRRFLSCVCSTLSFRGPPGSCPSEKTLSVHWPLSSDGRCHLLSRAWLCSDSDSVLGRRGVPVPRREAFSVLQTAPSWRRPFIVWAQGALLPRLQGWRCFLLSSQLQRML